MKRRLGALERAVGSFEAMAGLATFEEKRRSLLGKVDEVYDLAETGRNYEDKNGIEHRQPDSSGMVKCVELAARLLGVLAEAERRAKDGDGETREADIETVIQQLQKLGYSVKKAA